MLTKGTQTVFAGRCGGGAVGWVWWGWDGWVAAGIVVEGDAQLDLDVPPGDTDLVDDEAEQGLLLVEVELVDRGEHALGEAATRRRSWLSRVSSVRWAVRVSRRVVRSRRRCSTSAARRWSSGRSMSPAW